MYKEKDLGKHKVDLAKEWLREYNSTANFVSIKKQILSSDDIIECINNFDKIDMVVLSADYPSSILSYVHDACRIKNIPYIQAGYSDEVGICGPFVTNFNIDVNKTLPNQKNISDGIVDKIEKVNTNYITPVLCPVVALVSSYACREIIKFFIDKKDEIRILNKRLYLNFDGTENLVEFTEND